MPDLAQCRAERGHNLDQESPARCLFEVATGEGPRKVAATRRLQELVEEHPENPWFPYYLAKLKWSSDLAASETLYRRSLAVATRRGLSNAEFQALSGLCRILRDAGDLDQAASLTEQAVRAADASGEPLLRTKATILQAMQWTSQGEVARAHNSLSGIQEDVEAADDYQLHREYFFALGSTAQQTGQLHEARAAYDRFADLAAAQGDRTWEAQARYGSNAVLLEEINEMPRPGERNKLLALARRALDVARAAQSPSAEVQSLWMSGSLEDDLETAKESLERCFQVALASREKSYCRSALARRLAKTDPARAREAMQEALGLALESRHPLAWPAALREQMRVSWIIHPREKALEDSLAGLAAIEALRDRQEGSAGQPGLFSTWAEDYYWLSGRLLETGDLERAFTVIERMRARTLSDAIGVARAGSHLSPAHRARLAELLLDIAQVQSRMVQERLTPRELDAAKRELTRLEAEVEELRVLDRGAPTPSHPGKPPGLTSLEQVRRSLTSDEAFLSFQVAPWRDLLDEFGGGAWLLVLTRDSTRVYRLPDRLQLRPKVDLFIGTFADRNGSELDGSVALHQMLLGQALPELPEGVRRLVIVPDDALHRLPFAALRSKPAAEPLATRYEISTVPSAHLWLRWGKEQPAAAASPALVLADPPPTKPGAAAKRAAAFASEAEYKELPFARKEGRSVVRHLGGGSELLLGKDASEAALKQIDARRFAVYHFATHSFTDDVKPDHSYVYLAPGSPQQDGLLQAREIVDLDLRGRIVVLSSCESASGEILRGEGVMGLARAFFQAGATTVVASLWELRDDDGAALFDRFYKHVGEGMSVSAALQAAQRDRMQAGAPAEAWAGVVVLGDGNRIPLPGGRKGASGWELALLVAACGLVAAAILFILWRRLV